MSSKHPALAHERNVDSSSICEEVIEALGRHRHHGYPTQAASHRCARFGIRWLRRCITRRQSYDSARWQGEFFEKNMAPCGLRRLGLLRHGITLGRTPKQNRSSEQLASAMATHFCVIGLTRRSIGAAGCALRATRTQSIAAPRASPLIRYSPPAKLWVASRSLPVA